VNLKHCFRSAVLDNTYDLLLLIIFPSTKPLCATKVEGLGLEF